MRLTTFGTAPSTVADPLPRLKCRRTISAAPGSETEQRPRTTAGQIWIPLTLMQFQPGRGRPGDHRRQAGLGRLLAQLIDASDLREQPCRANLPKADHSNAHHRPSAGPCSCTTLTGGVTITLSPRGGSRAAPSRNPLTSSERPVFSSPRMSCRRSSPTPVTSCRRRASRARLVPGLRHDLDDVAGLQVRPQRTIEPLTRAPTYGGRRRCGSRRRSRWGQRRAAAPSLRLAALKQ